MITYRSTIQESFELRGRGTDGAVRVATATRHSGGFAWDLRLQHPSGRHWDGSYHGPHVLDALSELMNSKDVEFKQEKARGYRPEPRELYDSNRRIAEDAAVAPIIRRR